MKKVNIIYKMKILSNSSIYMVLLLNSSFYIIVIFLANLKIISYAAKTIQRHPGAKSCKFFEGCPLLLIEFPLSLY